VRRGVHDAEWSTAYRVRGDLDIPDSRHALALRFADSLYRVRANFKIVLLDDQSDTQFIAGDQPIINLHATLGSTVAEKFEFFYPLPPPKAMLLLEVGSDHTTSISAAQVRCFNQLIVETRINRCSRIVVDIWNRFGEIRES
jgi:hypothetical protein